MAQSLSDEQIQLRGKARRRLVGAIALVAVISAVLPMVLDNKPKPMSQDIAIDIPKQDDSGFAARNAATPAPAAPQGGSVIAPSAPGQEAPKAATPAPVLAAAPAVRSAEEAPAKPAEKAADKPKPVEKAAEKPAEKSVEKSAPKTAEKSSDKPAAKAPEKTADKTPPKNDKAQDKKSTDKPAKADKPAETKGDSFVVQLGAFSNADNAKQLQSKLTANHIKAYTDTLKNAGGDKVRVRAGPYASRAEADKALAKIKQLGLDGKVVPK